MTALAMDQMIDSTRSDWITPNEIPDPEKLPGIKGWNLLVRPIAPAEKTKSGIFLPDRTKDDLQYLTNVGRVVAMGSLCYTDPGVMTEIAKFPEAFDDTLNDTSLSRYGYYEEPWCKVGDFIIWAKNKGAKLKYQEIIYVMLKDEDVLATIDDPADISTLFNFTGYSYGE
jgi:co-chaperonin GroES (HSP10)